MRIAIDARKLNGHESGIGSYTLNLVKGLLAPYKCPRTIRFIGELPKTATGKLKRYELRRMAAKA